MARQDTKLPTFATYLLGDGARLLASPPRTSWLHQPFRFLGAGVHGPEALEGQVQLPDPFKDRRAFPSSSRSSFRC